jgi:hypothetical protein
MRSTFLYPRGFLPYHSSNAATISAPLKLNSSEGLIFHALAPTDRPSLCTPSYIPPDSAIVRRRTADSKTRRWLQKPFGLTPSRADESSTPQAAHLPSPHVACFEKAWLISASTPALIVRNAGAELFA